MSCESCKILIRKCGVIIENNIHFNAKHQSEGVIFSSTFLLLDLVKMCVNSLFDVLEFKKNLSRIHENT
jgi:hypothetical protein